MAIVKAPALSLVASGTVGNTNFTTWRGRAVARAKWIPVIPNTGLQVGIQGFLTLAVLQWRTVLTEDQRLRWRVYAKTQYTIDRLGTRRVPTGYHLYIGRQIQAYRIAGGVLIEPPISNLDRTAVTIEARPGALSGQIEWRVVDFPGTAVLGDGEYWAAGPYDSEARRPTSNEWRFHGYQAPPGWIMKAGIAVKWYWVRGRLAWTDGRITNWLETQIQAPP